MQQILNKAGFTDVQVFDSFQLSKKVESGETQSFPFIVATGVRP